MIAAACPGISGSKRTASAQASEIAAGSTARAGQAQGQIAQLQSQREQEQRSVPKESHKITLAGLKSRAD